jgi:hypothetical protein
MAAVEVWCRVSIVGPDDTELVAYALEGPGRPDLGAVDDVARWAQLAGRLGGRMVIADLSPSLGELLELVGLSVEVQGQAEEGEETLGLHQRQEEAHGGDLPA